jgi:glycosyltransferase involved in cell wall biosynthesis
VVDTELFYPSEPGEAVPGQGRKIKLLHVSGLKKLKNVGGILKVVKKVRETRGDFEFHVVGDGEEREVLEQMAAEMGLLNSEVFFHGQKTAAEVAEEMRKADFFVLFSDYENSPCVIVEAMASGLPVIAVDVGGIPEMVNEKTGILVPPKDEEELLKALISMMDNYDKYDRKYIRAEAVKRFGYETIGQQFCNIYQGIRKKTGQSRNA